MSFATNTFFSMVTFLVIENSGISPVATFEMETGTTVPAAFPEISPDIAISLFMVDSSLLPSHKCTVGFSSP